MSPRLSTPAPARSSRAGFTLLELMIAMSIFALLGGTAVYMMRQGASMFGSGARDSEMADRQDTLLPEVIADLARLAIPDGFDPPALPPEDQDLSDATPPPPPPPVAIRVRSGSVTMRDQGDPLLKQLACPFVAFVIHTGDEVNDARLRTAGDLPVSGETAKSFTRVELEKASAATVFKPTGGLMAVCWIAVPLDPARPSVLTLFRGFQSPLGGVDSLLEPASFDTLEEVRARFEKKHEGVLHFAVTWRRAGVTSWLAGTDKGGGEDTPYVGPVWDSTRALERTWSLFRDPTSLNDPSDDLFPQYARLEATLIPPSLGGYNRGDTRLTMSVPQDGGRIAVERLDPLLAPGAQSRFLKIGTEWMSYDATTVNAVSNEVSVQRGQRESVKSSHEEGAQVWVGTASSTVLALPAWRDRTFRKGPR